MARLTSLLRALLSALFLLLPVALVHAQGLKPTVAVNSDRLQVADPFLEVHTGPGRGYPVFYVVEKGQWVVVEFRRTDWYRVRAEGGQTGWVPRKQL